MHVTRAILPVMRNQRSGHVISISSGAGLSGFEFNSAYSAAKFALEGWMEALAPELVPFGIHTTIVNPGFFRTEFLTNASSTFAEPSIEDYDYRELVIWNSSRIRTGSSLEIQKNLPMPSSRLQTRPNRRVVLLQEPTR